MKDGKIETMHIKQQGRQIVYLDAYMDFYRFALRSSFIFGCNLTMNFSMETDAIFY